MGIFSKKDRAERLKLRNKDRVERNELRESGIENLSLPDTVRVVGESGFRACRSLKTAVLPEQLCELGAFAFRDCDALETITMPQTMRYPDESAGSIGTGCFEGCGLLRSIVIPEGVTVLPANVFHNCAALESVTLPRSLCAIQNGAFAGCARLATLELTAALPDLIAADAFQDTPQQERIQLARKPILTIRHTSSFGAPELYQFAAVPRLIGEEQTERDLSIILDACDAERVSFRITHFSHAGGSHTIPANVVTRLFYEEYDCAGPAGLQKEEILASYR